MSTAGTTFSLKGRRCTAKISPSWGVSRFSFKAKPFRDSFKFSVCMTAKPRASRFTRQLYCSLSLIPHWSRWITPDCSAAVALREEDSACNYRTIFSSAEAVPRRTSYIPERKSNFYLSPKSSSTFASRETRLPTLSIRDKNEFSFRSMAARWAVTVLLASCDRSSIAAHLPSAVLHVRQCHHSCLPWPMETKVVTNTWVLLSKLVGELTLRAGWELSIWRYSTKMHNRISRSCHDIQFADSGQVSKQI